jgi:P27 family predicted phage terminase small subunit
MARKPGPRPAPTALLKLRGSLNPTRALERKFEPIAQGELADEEPPPDLTESQEDFWRYAVANMPRGVMKRIDRELLRVWVEAADRHNTARLMQAMLDRDSKLKLLIKTPDGLAPSPYNDIIDKAAKIMIRVAQELGFSPAARPRIKADPPTIDADAEDDVRSDPWSFLEVNNGPPN